MHKFIILLLICFPDHAYSRTMSLSSLVSAVQTAVDMSDAAVSAAAEALAASKLAGLQAKAALAAVHLALEIDTNMKNVGGNNNDGTVPNANIETKPAPADLKIIIGNGGVEEGQNKMVEEIPFSDEEAGDPSLASIDNFTEDMKLVNGQMVKGYEVEDNYPTPAATSSESSVKSVAHKKGTKWRSQCENCHLDSRYPCLHGRNLFKVLPKTKGMKVKACGRWWSPDKLGKIGEVVGGDHRSVQIMWDRVPARGDSGYVVSYSLLAKGEYIFKFWCQDTSEVLSARGQGIRQGQTWRRQGGVI